MKRKGFTLIELLAVIVILAIIALIAVPVIMNIIAKSNKSAFKDSAYGIVKAGELYYAGKLLDTNGMESDITVTFPDASGLEIKGTKPTGGSMIIRKNGDIQLAITNGKYCVRKNFKDSDVTIDEDITNCTLQASTGKMLGEIATTDTSLGVTSVDSCVTSGTCAKGVPFAIKVNDSEIHKFYVINDNGSEVTLIMDRNLGSRVEWINEIDFTAAGGTDFGTNGSSNKGPLTALKLLEERTSGWTNIEPFSYTVADDSGTNRYSSVKRTNVRARMLNITEANGMGCADICPRYLFENLSVDNTEAAPVGYWLSSAYAEDTYLAQFLIHSGSLSMYPVNRSDNNGIRPVIKVSKN